MNAWLLDTGPIVAYLNRTDPWHDRVADCLDRFGGRLHTTSAVITECMHFLQPHPAGPALLVEFLAAARVNVLETSTIPQLQRTILLMAKYTNVPMDFADATLVLLAEQLGVFDVCTLDRRGFATYRSTKGKKFINVMDL